jgi:phosphate:Na+ symporter
MAADFHTGFNLILALVFIPALDHLAALLTYMVPERERPPDRSVPIYLDNAAITTPTIGLSAAARETLHMGDLVEVMLEQGMIALMTGDRKLVADCLPNG